MREFVYIVLVLFLTSCTGMDSTTLKYPKKDADKNVFKKIHNTIISYNEILGTRTEETTHTVKVGKKKVTCKITTTEKKTTVAMDPDDEEWEVTNVTEECN